jgi:uncharacterized cupin superfamily protein
MTIYQNRPVAAAFRDADSVRRGSLPAEVSMEPVVSGASFAREDAILDCTCTTPVPPFRTGTQPARFVSAPDLARGDQAIFDGPDGRCAVRTIAPGVQDQVNHDRARFTYVLAGEASVADANGLTRELTAGCAIAFPAGWSGIWRVRTPLRTFDVFSTPAAR